MNRSGSSKPGWRHARPQGCDELRFGPCPQFATGREVRRQRGLGVTGLSARKLRTVAVVAAVDAHQILSVVRGHAGLGRRRRAIRLIDRAGSQQIAEQARRRT